MSILQMLTKGTYQTQHEFCRVKKLYAELIIGSQIFTKYNVRFVKTVKMGSGFLKFVETVWHVLV